MNSIFPFSHELSKASREKLQRDSKKHRFNKSEVIIRKGQKLSGIYIVRSGVLRVYSLDLNGNEKPIYWLNNGEVCIFSINCALQKTAYPAWVTIDSDTAEVFHVPITTFRNMYDQEPAAREFILEVMSQRIFDLMTLIEEAAIVDLGSRINSFLVRTCNEKNIVAMSHQHIADSLGTAREVVSRHLKTLEKEGFVQLSRMQIFVVSPEDLAQLSHS